MSRLVAAAVLVLGQLAANAPDASAPLVASGAPGAPTFTLVASSRPEGSQVVVTLQGSGGAIPITTPHWTCAWSLVPEQAPISLIVECFPLSKDQGVTTAVSCSRTQPSKDLAVMLITTREDFEEQEPSHKTQLRLTCSRP